MASAYDWIVKCYSIAAAAIGLKRVPPLVHFARHHLESFVLGTLAAVFKGLMPNLAFCKALIDVADEFRWAPHALQNVARAEQCRNHVLASMSRVRATAGKVDSPTRNSDLNAVVAVAAVNLIAELPFFYLYIVTGIPYRLVSEDRRRLSDPDTFRKLLLNLVFYPEAG